MNSLKPMDPMLARAIYLNDVEFLEKAVKSQPEDYFLCTFAAGYDPGRNDECAPSGNIFHLSVLRPEIFHKTMELLPPDIKVHLLSQKSKNDTVLHIMVRDERFYLGGGHIRTRVVKLMLNFFKSYPGPLTVDQKPWLMTEGSKNTPLHFALRKERDNINEELVMEILSMDGMEQPCAAVDEYDISPLYYAIESGCIRVAEKILSSFPKSCSVACPNGSTLLHFAPNCESETVLRSLLIDHRNLMEIVDDHGFNVLHKWAEIGEVWPLNFISNGEFPEVMNTVLNVLINQRTFTGSTPLNIARASNSEEMVSKLKELIGMNRD